MQATYLLHIAVGRAYLLLSRGVWPVLTTGIVSISRYYINDDLGLYVHLSDKTDAPQFYRQYKQNCRYVQNEAI
jgi:hypothetical protein